jgi:hypothetical protein
MAPQPRIIPREMVGHSPYLAGQICLASLQIVVFVVLAHSVSICSIDSGKIFSDGSYTNELHTYIGLCASSGTMKTERNP